MRKYLQLTIITSLFYCLIFLRSVLCHAASVSGLPIISVFPEEIFQGDVALIKISPASQSMAAYYTIQEKTIPFFPDNKYKCFYAWLAIDLEENPGKKEISIYIKTDTGGLKNRRIHINVLKKQFFVQKLSVPESQVTLSPENLMRHNKEQSMLETIFKKLSHERLWEECFIPPIKAEITTPFGVKRFFNNKPRQPHSGIDFKASKGTPVHASASGRVVFVGDLFFSGKSIIVDHGTGVVSMYFHLGIAVVSPGTLVHQGDVIGFVGSTGRVTGPHLHWSFRVHNQRVDPLSLLKLCPHLDAL